MELKTSNPWIESSRTAFTSEGVIYQAVTWPTGHPYAN